MVTKPVISQVDIHQSWNPEEIYNIQIYNFFPQRSTHKRTEYIKLKSDFNSIQLNVFD